MGEGMAVVFAQRALGRGADVAEDESGGGLGGDSLEVRAVPSGDGRSEEAWRRAKFGIGVEAYAEAIGVVLSFVLWEASRSEGVVVG